MGKWIVFLALLILIFPVNGRAQGPSGVDPLASDLIKRAIHLNSPQDAKEVRSRGRISLHIWDEQTDLRCSYSGTMRQIGQARQVALVSWQFWPLQCLLIRLVAHNLTAQGAVDLDHLLAQYRIEIVGSRQGVDQMYYELRAYAINPMNLYQVDVTIGGNGVIPLLVLYYRDSKTEPFRSEQTFTAQVDGRMVLKQWKVSTKAHFSDYGFVRPYFVIVIDFESHEFCMKDPPDC